MDKRRVMWIASSGQAIVIIAFMLVALIAMAGLAIDGGEMYLGQRRTQNAIDAALLNASYTLCTGGTTEEALTDGYAAALANNFAEFDDGLDPTSDVDRQMDLNSPPTMGAFAGLDGYVEALAYMDVRSWIIQLVYSGATEISISGVVQCQPEVTAFAGYSFAALADNDSKAYDLSGGGDVYFCGGGAWSNSGAESSNNSAPLIMDPSHPEYPADGCPDPDWHSVGTWAKPENLPNPGDLTTGGTVAPDPFADVDPPARPASCDPVISSSVELEVNGTLCISGISLNNGNTVTISGAEDVPNNILYIDGDLAIKSGDDLIVDGVFIYVDGIVDLKGDTTMEPSYYGGFWDGFMMWGTAVGNGAFDTNASATNKLKGTFYFPDGNAIVNGGSASEWRLQFIANKVDFAGGGGDIFFYEEEWFFHIPPQIAIID